MWGNQPSPNGQTEVDATGDDVPVPGFDVKPSALHWYPAVAARELAATHYLQALGRLADRPDEALSLSIKAPFCGAHCLCCDRDIRAGQSAAVIDEYVSCLVKEIKAVAAQVGIGRDVLQLHLGGGTATELGDSQLARLVHTLRHVWRLPADADMSADCDPRRLGWVQLRLLRGLGFRRLSLGVLDLAPAVQRAIGRFHSASLIDDVCALARECGIECINLELMIGLPHQSKDTWRDTLAHVIAIAPDRVTLARYRHHPRQAPGQYAIDEDALPDAQACQELATLAADLLCCAGYRWIGGDQFVTDTDELAVALDEGRLRRSVMAYCASPATAVIGLGAGALSDIDGHVFRNEADIGSWRRAVQAGTPAVAHAHLPTEQGVRRRRAVEQLLCQLEFPAASAQGGLEAAYQRLARHDANGLVRELSDRIIVTDAGRHALPMLCSELLGRMAGGVPDGAHWLS